MEPRNRADQHDTVVLNQGRPTAGATGAGAPATAGQQDAPGNPAASVGSGTPSDPRRISPAPHDDSEGGGSPDAGRPRTWPAPGWQSVSDWRAAALAHRSTAWSQLPPFIPSAAPPVVVMRNSAAVVGASLGSVGLFLSLLPVLGIVAWVIAPIGLLSSVVGLVVGVSRKAGRVGALWGMLTSGLALVVCLAWTVLVLGL